MITKYDVALFIFGLAFALYWQHITPIQYTGDSEGYLNVAHLLIGQPSPGMAAIFRSPGYPLLMLFTGTVYPGTFSILLLTQALFAAITPVIIYRILIPYNKNTAIGTSIIAILTGTTTIHTSQIMTESLFTFLLYIGLALTIKIIKDKNILSLPLYIFAFVFALLNSVRPIAWPIFWVLLALIVWRFWYEEKLVHTWKTIIKTAMIFMALMILWGIVDDVALSSGARYSPLLPARNYSDTRIENYIYDLPFNEAYFSSWQKRIEHIDSNINSLDPLNEKPAMKKIRDIIINQLIENKDEILNDTTSYPHHLFGKYIEHPQELAERIFAFPNYIYANYVRATIEKAVLKKERLKLYYDAAKEEHRTWPSRWVELFRHQPWLFFTGPTHGNGSQRFLMAYTSLRHYVPDPNVRDYRSLINENNGPATRMLFTILSKALQSNPELWKGTAGLFGSNINNPDALENIIITNPNQTYAWDITVTLWDLMGYNTTSLFLDKVANEAFSLYKEALLLRVWDTALMVLAGPGYIEFDNLGPELGRVEIYDHLETQQPTSKQKKELRVTKTRYNDIYKKWQVPVKLGYFLFYICKPIFLLTSIMSMVILWARKRLVIVPTILMIPYFISAIIYGSFLTALPRYTDPTILLPFIVTLMAIPECIKIIRDRKHVCIN
ncbi:MAG: hypothetical protein P1U74_01735 [Legionellaceae bacterium]|nr:hypothetical protein [Legionellaceae bacterium]